MEGGVELGGEGGGEGGGRGGGEVNKIQCIDVSCDRRWLTVLDSSGVYVYELRGINGSCHPSSIIHHPSSIIHHQSSIISSSIIQNPPPLPPPSPFHRHYPSAIEMCFHNTLSGTLLVRMPDNSVSLILITIVAIRLSVAWKGRVIGFRDGFIYILNNENHMNFLLSRRYASSSIRHPSSSIHHPSSSIHHHPSSIIHSHHPSNSSSPSPRSNVTVLKVEMGRVMKWFLKNQQMEMA